MSDLLRSRFSYALYAAGAKVLLRNSFAYDDGRLSIRKAFTKTEALRLVAEHPALQSLRVQTCFPGHLVFLGDKASQRCPIHAVAVVPLKEAEAPGVS